MERNEKGEVRLDGSDEVAFTVPAEQSAISFFGLGRIIHPGDAFGEDYIVRNSSRKDRKWFTRLGYGHEVQIWPPKYKDKKYLVKLEAAMVKAHARALKRSEARTTVLKGMVKGDLPFFVHGVTNLVGTSDQSKDYMIELDFHLYDFYGKGKLSFCTSWNYIGEGWGRETPRGERNDHAIKYFFESEKYTDASWRSFRKLHTGFLYSLKEIFFPGHNHEPGKKLEITLNGRRYIYEFDWKSDFCLKPLLLPGNEDVTTVTL